VRSCWAASTARTASSSWASGGSPNTAIIVAPVVVDADVVDAALEALDDLLERRHHLLRLGQRRPVRQRRGG
jgi:hypothetical protein